MKSKFVKIMAVIAVTLKAYNVLHEYATRCRGYEAIGGEIMVFVLPIIVWIAVDTFKKTAALGRKRRGVKNG